MTVRELIKELLNCPLDDQVYVGKGMGPAQSVRSGSELTGIGERVWWVIYP